VTGPSTAQRGRSSLIYRSNTRGPPAQRVRASASFGHPESFRRSGQRSYRSLRLRVLQTVIIGSDGGLRPSLKFESCQITRSQAWKASATDLAATVSIIQCGIDFSLQSPAPAGGCWGELGYDCGVPASHRRRAWTRGPYRLASNHRPRFARADKEARHVQSFSIVCRTASAFAMSCLLIVAGPRRIWPTLSVDRLCPRPGRGICPRRRNVCLRCAHVGSNILCEATLKPR
jgi:hypothetical protein